MGIFNRILSFFTNEGKTSGEGDNVTTNEVEHISGGIRDDRYEQLIQDNQKWDSFTEEDPTVPRSIQELDDLKDFLLNERDADLIPEYISDRIPEIKNVFEESEFEHDGGHDKESEVVRRLYDNYFMAVDKAVGSDEELLEKYRKQIDKNLSGSKLSANGNFQLLYTATAEQNGFVDRIADNLERALETYKNELNVTPYWPHQNSAIVVEVYRFFGRLSTFKGYTYPNYAIEINESFLGIENGEDNDPLEATPAHELFHKIQYNFGYKTEWFKPSTHEHIEGVTHSHSDDEPDDHFHNEEIFSWFSEGTASWGEYYVTQNVSNLTKISSMLQSPETPLFKNNAESLPFWNFVFNHLFTAPYDTVHPMNILLNQLKQTKGKVLTTLLDTVKKADNDIKNMNDLFMRFCNFRRMIDIIEIDGREQSFRSVINSANSSLFDMENEYLDVSPLACKYHSHEFYDPLQEGERILIKVVPEDAKDCLICELAVNKQPTTYRLKYKKSDKTYRIILDSTDFNVAQIESITLMVAGKMGPNEYYAYQLICEDV